VPLRQPGECSSARSEEYSPGTYTNIRKLADFSPRTLAVMHGSSFTGDAAVALQGLADGFEARLQAAMQA